MAPTGYTRLMAPAGASSLEVDGEAVLIDETGHCTVTNAQAAILVQHHGFVVDEGVSPALALRRTVEEGLPEPGNVETWNQGATCTLIQDGMPSQEFKSKKGSDDIWYWEKVGEGRLVTE